MSLTNVSPLTLLISGKLSHGDKVGPFVVLNVTFAAANTDKTIPHLLGRKPNGVLQWRSKTGGLTYDGSLNGADWDTTNIVLRNTAAGEVTWLFCF